MASLLALLLEYNDLAGDFSRMDLYYFTIISPGPNNVLCIQYSVSIIQQKEVQRQTQRDWGEIAEAFQLMIFSKLTLILDKFLASCLKRLLLKSSNSTHVY